jgi:hypothetical protein
LRISARAKKAAEEQMRKLEVSVRRRTHVRRGHM